MNFLKLCIIGFLIIINGQVKAETTHIAVAANFAAPIKKLIVIFERETEHKVQLSIGSSGKIYAQIVNGAPFDGFLSADQEKPSLLVEQGLAVKNSQFTYATGILVLWAPHLDVFAPKTDDETSGKIAIANPKTAPYGKAALQMMEKNGMLAEIKDHLILADNVAQAYQFISSGAVEFGYVALSQIIDQAKNDYIIVKDQDYAPIKQDAVMLKTGMGNPATVAFLSFLQSQKIKDMIKKFGYK